MARYIKKTQDGRYGLKANGELIRLAGRDSFTAGFVMYPANIEIAADAADEEARVLMAQAREEFGS
jgi:hypothetical protein